MKILALSDRVEDDIYSEQVKDLYGDVDAVIGCGDLPFYYLEYVATMLKRPTYYVRGNHDTNVQYRHSGRVVTGPEGCTSLEGRVVNIGGLLVAGLGGSVRYRPGGGQQFTEGEMRNRLAGLLPLLLANRIRHGRYLDVLVTHAAPYGIHDDPSDRAHVGFRIFLNIMAWFKPRYLLHGHMHIWNPETITKTHYRATTVLNVYPSRVIDIPTPDGKNPKEATHEH